MLNSTPPTNQLPGPPHYVYLHVNPGESVSIQFCDGNETVLSGPTTIKMVSQHVYPPMPMPVQVPPGHMIQQVVDEHGTLKHIILSSLNVNGSSGTAGLGPIFQQAQYCCCCNNTCSPQPVNNASATSTMAPSVATPMAAAAAAANQMIQPQATQMNHSSMVFPLSHSPATTYVRNRRSTRNYSSPNKRSSYQNANNVVNNTNYYTSSNNNSNNNSNSITTKGNGNQMRYTKSSSQSDNLKTNQYNRYNSNSAMHYNSNDNRASSANAANIYDQMSNNDSMHNNNNKYATMNNNHNHKLTTYDYVTPTYSTTYNNNSSNNTSPSLGTLDQINDNLKYYKDDHDQYSVTTDDDQHHSHHHNHQQQHHFTKKSSYSSSLNSQPTNSYLDEYNVEDVDNLTNDVENMSQKSSLSETVDMMNNQYSSPPVNTTNSHRDKTTNNKTTSNNVKHSNYDSVKSSSETKQSKLKTNAQNDQKKDDHRKKDSDRIICETDSVKNSTTMNNKKSTNVDNVSKTDQKIVNNSNNPTQPIIILDDQTNEPMGDIKSNLSKCTSSTDTKESSNQKSDMKQETANKDKKEEKNWSSVTTTSDNKLNIANGHLEHLADQVDSNSGSEQMETDKTGTESDENENRTAGDSSKMEQTNSSTPSRSPKHLLPKIEALKLKSTNVTSSSVRLEWHFSQPNEYPEQKRHYIVDSLLNHESTSDDTPITKMVHQGPNTYCFLSHLQSQQKHAFRVRTSTETAWLVSNILTVETLEGKPNYNRNRKTNKQLNQQLQQQKQLIQLQQQQLLQHQQIMEQQQQQEKQKQHSSASDLILMNPAGVISADQGYALILLIVFTAISLLVAVVIHHFLSNHW